eukprot:maker-scaffold348_size200312-snap-gene-1.16 protein:Tk10905 transcript:maker-scaffold348_size200312-snap-gene-1.16-mRNA-1 annotation:"AT27402p"
MASSAGSAMVASIQRVGEKVRALSGSTNFVKPTPIQGLGHYPSVGSNMPPCPEAMTQSLVITNPGDSHGVTGLMSHSDHQFLPQSSLNFDLPHSKEGSCKSVGAEDNKSESNVYCQPHPLPMPEYGGWFAPLTEFLPSSSQPIQSFHRSNLAVIFLTDLVVDGLDLDCHGQLSARSTDDNSGASSVSSTSSSVFPPNSLPLEKIGKRRFSGKAATGADSTSDTDDEGELSDHDLTPCNVSPSLSQLLNWSTGSHGANGNEGENRLLEQDECEEHWKNHVQVVMQDPNNESLIFTFFAFARLFHELRLKTCLMSQDAVFSLSKEKSTFSLDSIKQASDQFQEVSDVLSEVTNFPHVWCDFEGLGGTKLVERIKFNILEIQENFDNFMDKKELTLECLDAVKMHQKLVNLGEQLDYNIDTEQVDLCRCLFKLHFQLLLLLESFVKLVRLILQGATLSPELKNISSDVLEKRNELLKVVPSRVVVSTPIEGSPQSKNEERAEEEEEERPHSSASESGMSSGLPSILIVESGDEKGPSVGGDESGSEFSSLNSSEISTSETILFEAQSKRESEYHVFGLLCERKWASVLAYYRQQHRGKWTKNQSTSEEDDLTAILHIYCQILSERGENIFAVTVSDGELNEHCNRLKDSSLQLQGIVKSMEGQLAKQKQTPSRSNTESAL